MSDNLESVKQPYLNLKTLALLLGLSSHTRGKQFLSRQYQSWGR